jgi:hypothetical protein
MTMSSRELTINGVFWTVEFVPPDAEKGGERTGARSGGGLQYVSENGYRCFVPLADTGLGPSAEAFASASDDLVAQWALRALRRRHARVRPPHAA